jgi:hypothetical protein
MCSDLLADAIALLAVLAGNAAAKFRATGQHSSIAALGVSWHFTRTQADTMAGSRLARHAAVPLLSMLLLFVLGATAAVRADSSAEDVKDAPSGVPDLDLAKWNQAYKVTVANVTEGELKR